jgi:hypothetical protein
MNRLTKESFITKANNIYGNEYDYCNVIYINNKTKVKINCNNCNSDFFQTPNNHLNYHGCPFCSRIKSGELKKYTTESFVKKASVIHENKYNYGESIYVNSLKKIKINCKKHGMFEQTPSEHLRGKGCSKCVFENTSNRMKKTQEEFIENANNLHENKFDYSKVNYIKSNIKVNIICKKHGEFLQSPNNHLIGAGCPVCNESKGENKIRGFLVKNKVNFLKEKTFNGCENKKSLYFDFYLPDYNLLIEYDGALHFKSVNFFGGENGFTYRKNNDELKNKFAFENDIELLRINYFDFDKIDEILNHTLINMQSRVFI